MATAVLLSGGLDSAVLVADEVVRGGLAAVVQPIYVSTGLSWEDAERAMVSRLLEAPPLAGRTRPLATLTVDMRDVYAASHWAVTGQAPAYHTPDEDVYLPGRNVILLGKAGVFAAAAQLDRIVLGTLGHNPFPDATPQFRDAMARALSLGLAHEVHVEAPYAQMTKTEVILRGRELGVPLALTLSCMNPAWREPGKRFESFERIETREPIHCGTCSKCRERHDAFVDAGVIDPTTYADERFVRA